MAIFRLDVPSLLARPPLAGQSARRTHGYPIIASVFPDVMRLVTFNHFGLYKSE